MSALTADFNSTICNQTAQLSRTIAAGTAAYIGGLAQLDSTGNYVAPAASGVTRKIVGQFVKGAASTDTADTTVPVREGDVLLNISAVSGPTAANIGAQVYADSDNEVTTASSGRAKAGILLAIQDGQALVRVSQTANL